MKKMTKATIVLSFCIILLLMLNVVAYAISTNDISVSSPSYGYYLQGDPFTSLLTISGANNNPATVRLLYPYTTYKTGRSELGYLNKNSSSYTYSGTYYPSSAYWTPGKKAGSHGLWESRNFCVEAKKDGTTITKEVSGYITAGSRSDYSNTDNSFYYTNSTSNPFRGVGTPSPNEDTLTYNCLAYAVSVNTSWQWPWKGRNPTQEELDNYMSKKGEYVSRSGDTLSASTITGCDVIYYTNETTWGSGTDGHFARVIAWDASGIPTRISSKWGCMEIIESSSYNPFKRSGSYGLPKRYYKY